MSCNTALKRWGTPPSSTESPDKEISRFPGLECASGLHGNSTWTTNLPKTEWANHLSFQKIVPPKIIQSPILVLRTPPVFLFLFFILCKTWPSSSGFQDRLQIQQGVDGGLEVVLEGGVNCWSTGHDPFLFVHFLMDWFPGNIPGWARSLGMEQQSWSCSIFQPCVVGDSTKLENGNFLEIRFSRLVK